MRPAMKFVAINALVLLLVFSGIIWAICLATSIYHLVRAGSEGHDCRGRPKKSQRAQLRQDRFGHSPISWSSIRCRRSMSATSGGGVCPSQARPSTSKGPMPSAAPWVRRMPPSRPYISSAAQAFGEQVRTTTNTIPSQFTQLTGYHTENFGKSAYTAHQGLEMLIRLLQDGHRPNIVVFYDGANDVIHKCRSELNAWSHAREHQI